jgi:hypothetical protein
MDFWEGKCFKCIVIGWLVAITALSINGESKYRKTPPPTQDTTLQQ